MSVWPWLSRLIGARRRNPDARGSGEDVALDPALASSRATGGDHIELGGDRGSTTGTGRTDEFALERTTTATLTDDRAVDYRGVTVIRLDGEHIAALRTGYDTAAFTKPPAATVAR